MVLVSLSVERLSPQAFSTSRITEFQLTTLTTHDLIHNSCYCEAVYFKSEVDYENQHHTLCVTTGFIHTGAPWLLPKSRADLQTKARLS